MRIVVLDGYTLNPGDLSWDNLYRLGDLTIFDRTPPDLILERAEGAEILFTNKTPLRVKTLSQLPELRYIGVLATGYDVVDIDAARERGIAVTNVPAYSTFSVTQMVFALLLELCHHVQAHSDLVKEGAWSRNIDFTFWKYPLMELAGKTMGIVGFGRIGGQVAHVASAMGMHILATTRTKKSPPPIDNFRWVNFSELFSKSDVVSLHCPLTTESRGLISRDTIELMKSTSLLINTARGGLVVDEDLAQALNTGRIAGAGLDVLSVEPPSITHPLMTAKNCLITPHIAWASKEARTRLMSIAIENLQAFLDCQPVNVVG
ncbi:MAG: D-2-hydroxyacid dehydrogenase [Bacillota bacterium]